MRETVHPPHVWATMHKPDGGRYGYVEKGDADAQLAKLKKIQPHAVMRVSPA